MGLQDNSFERTILALSNELQRIRSEAEWRNDATSQCRSCTRKNYIWHLFAPYSFLAGTNRFSTTSHVSMGHYSEYTDEYETYWIEFTALLIIGGKEKVVLQHNCITFYQSKSVLVLAH